MAEIPIETGVTTKLRIHQATRAVYAGSFDPPTKGHLGVIEQGAALFDELHVAVAINPSKHSMFSLTEKLEMLEGITADYSNVTVGHIGRALLANYAKANGYQFLLRGIRSADDYAKEKQLRSGNQRIQPEVRSIYVMCPPENEDISSSLVKGLVGYEQWEEIASEFVPDIVLQALKRNYAQKLSVSEQ